VNPKAKLYRLQEIDTARDKIRLRILKLQKLSGGSSQLVKARRRTQAAEAELEKILEAQKEAELEANSLSARIQESESLLMGGEVRNPKELEALQANVDSMRRHRSTLEDSSVEALVKADELGQVIAKQTRELEQQEAEWQTKRQAIDQELLKRKKEYLYLKHLREQAVQIIDDKMLEQYEYLRGRKDGVAVAKLDDGSCTACHMQVPIGVIGNVERSEELIVCPACGRILCAE